MKRLPAQLFLYGLIVIAVAAIVTHFMRKQKTASALEALKIPPPQQDTTPPPPAAPLLTDCKDTAYPILFEAAFFPGTRFIDEDYDDTVALRTLDIGKLRIETGRLVACDPIELLYIKPFAQRFPNGDFPVQLSLANYGREERIAFSRIVFSDQPVVHWEPLAREGNPRESMRDRNASGYAVDAGKGVFADAAAATALSAKDTAFEYNLLYRESEKNYRSCYSYTVQYFDGHNIAVFTSGMGDGVYVTYGGYDANGKICRVLTSFKLAGWWKP